MAIVSVALAFAVYYSALPSLGDSTVLLSPTGASMSSHPIPTHYVTYRYVTDNRWTKGSESYIDTNYCYTRHFGGILIIVSESMPLPASGIGRGALFVYPACIE
jgi:hypothetical protein